MSDRLRKLCVVLVTLGVCGLAEHAAASGLSAPVVGTTRSGTNNVDPAATFWNPAQLAFIEQPRLMLGANLVLGSVRYTRQRYGLYQQSDSFDFALPIDASAVDPSKTGESEATNTFIAGPQPDISLAIPFGDSGLVAGVGLFAPFVALIDFDEDGAQRFQVQNATIAVIATGGSLAYRVSDNFSFGAGVGYLIGIAELEKISDFATLDDLGAGLAGPPVNQENDFGSDAPVGVRELDVLARPTQISGAVARGVTFNVGIAARLADRVRLAVSYHHSAVMHFRGTFELNMDDDFFTQDLAAQGLQFDPLIEGEASISFTVPNRIFAGLAYRVSDRVELGLNLEYGMWSTIDTFDVVIKSEQLRQEAIGLPDTATLTLKRDWHNTVSASLLADYAISERVLGWAMAGYQQGAVPDSTIDTASPDGHRIEFAIGGDVILSRRYRMIADAKMQQVLRRTVTTSEYDLGNGTYGMTLFSIGLHLDIVLGKLGSERGHAQWRSGTLPGVDAEAAAGEPTPVVDEAAETPPSDGTREPNSTESEDSQDDSEAEEIPLPPTEQHVDPDPRPQTLPEVQPMPVYRY